MKENQF